MKTHEWTGELISCPSQCYYHFQDELGERWCIYLRWRHSDPWTAKLIPCMEDWEFGDWSEWEDLHPSFWTEDQVDEVMKEAFQKVKDIFPRVVFPENPKDKIQREFTFNNDLIKSLLGES